MYANRNMVEDEIVLLQRMGFELRIHPAERMARLCSLQYHLHLSHRRGAYSLSCRNERSRLWFKEEERHAQVTS